MSAVPIATRGRFCENQPIGIVTRGYFCDGTVIPQPKQPKHVPASNYNPWYEQALREDEEIMLLLETIFTVQQNK